MGPDRRPSRSRETCPSTRPNCSSMARSFRVPRRSSRCRDVDLYILGAETCFGRTQQALCGPSGEVSSSLRSGECVRQPCVPLPQQICHVSRQYEDIPQPPDRPAGDSNSTTSVIDVPSAVGSNRCSCHHRRNGPDLCSSTNRCGASYRLITEVIVIGIPKWRAFQVTESPWQITPEVTPAMARSPEADIDDWCASAERLSSKHRSGDAGISVVSSIRGTRGF